MCEELTKEYQKLFAQLKTVDDENYVKDAFITHMKKHNSYSLLDYYNWKKVDNVTYYRKYDDIYVATDIGYNGSPNRFAKLPVEKHIMVHGLYDLNKKCEESKNLHTNIW